MKKLTRPKKFIFIICLTLIVIFMDASNSLEVEYILDESLVKLGYGYKLHPNIIYKTVEDENLKLDLYENNTHGLHPVILGIHGGGWEGGKKEEMQSFFWPFLALGFSAINVEYRLAPKFLAPAAVEDCLCALKWTIDNSAKYNFDLEKIVTAGFSAGGHLALTTAMIPQSGKIVSPCQDDQKMKVAAVINLFGPSDLVDLISGVNYRPSAKNWIGDRPDSLEIALLVSPLQYVRPGLPPILTIHGDIDPVVPCSQSVRLHQALDRAGVPNELYTMLQAGHGNFSFEQTVEAHQVSRSFLRKFGIIK